jgi:hypothetical protein
MPEDDSRQRDPERGQHAAGGERHAFTGYDAACPHE